VDDRENDRLVNDADRLTPGDGEDHEIAGSEDGGVAPQRQLRGELPADAAVAPGDEHDAGHCVGGAGGRASVTAALPTPASARVASFRDEGARC
jgi:hypothetical protein